MKTPCEYCLVMPVCMNIFTEWKMQQTGITINTLQLIVLLRNRCSAMTFYTNKVGKNYVTIDDDKKDEVIRFYYDLTEKVPET